MRPLTPSDLLHDGVLDAELAGLLWLLVEGGVPVVVTGTVGPEARSSLAAALVALVPDRGWVVLDLDAEPPGPDRLAALLQGGVGLGLSVSASDLAAMLDVATGTLGLPADAVRRLGVVVVAVHRDGRLRCEAVHYLRPTERDGQGHLQRRPPAVLAAWDERDDSYEHNAWGITPELADRVDRAQADFEERQRDRARVLAGLAATSTSARDWEARIRETLRAEPAREPAPSRDPAKPSPFQRGLTDPHPH
jgi:hypothetical protein